MPIPSYPLPLVQAQVTLLGPKAFSATALNSGQDELGLTVGEMIDLILSRTDTTCYKTMPSTQIPGAMQDVYRWPILTGQTAYVKFCLHPHSKVVVSFKEK